MLSCSSTLETIVFSETTMTLFSISKLLSVDLRRRRDGGITLSQDVQAK
jgi:hypothetical protein